MTLHYFLLLICGAAAGGFLSGLAGFGTALFSLGFWLQIMTPTEAVSLAVVMAVISGIPGVWMIRKTMLDNMSRLLRFSVPAVVGVPLGIVMLSAINPVFLKLVIACFLILYGGFFAFRKNLPKLQRPTPLIDAVVGFTGGVLGGSTGLSGALPTMWCAMRPWTKQETRAVLQPFNVLILVFAASLFAVKGIYDSAALMRIAIACPVTICFAFIGMAIFRRLSDDHFRRLLIALMLLSGLVLMTREWLL